jgi:hypothetical protein
MIRQKLDEPLSDGPRRTQDADFDLARRRCYCRHVTLLA